MRRYLLTLLLIVAGCHAPESNAPLQVPAGLRDQQGQVFNDARLRGRWHYVFFGFTGCSDICPLTLLHLRRIKEAVLTVAPHLPVPNVVLVSVDPHNDSEDNLRAYLSSFDPEFVGVRGEEETVQKFEALFAASHRSAGGPRKIDHTAEVYLVDSHGLLVARYTPPFDSEVLAREYARLAADEARLLARNE